jgi:glycosyltransferase involved in cell wall biosynthesis
MDGDADLDVTLNEPVDLDGVHVHYFHVPWLRRLWWAPAMGAQLRKSIDTFDVVHLHSVFLWPIRAAARAATRAGVPYILTPRGMLVREMIRRKNRWIKTLWITFVERASIARAAALHVTADAEGEELRALFGSLVPDIVTIPNGIDWPSDRSSAPASPFTQLPERYGLFLSRISWKKGLDRLITAWRDIPDLPLVVAGNDEENYRPKLEALARSLGVSDRVIFLGHVSDIHKWTLYERAELFVLPSYSENFGNAVAEAMAMGCPVVVSPDVGIAELLKAEGAGIVTDCDPPQLAAAIRGLLSDPQARRELGRRGQAAVRKRLLWDAIAAQTEQLYRRVIDRHFSSCGRAQPALTESPR